MTATTDLQTPPHPRWKDNTMPPTAPRDLMEDAIRRELWGPVTGAAPPGPVASCAGGAVDLDQESAYCTLLHDKDSGQEVLVGIEPARRYGIGVLFPGGTVTGAYPADGTEAGEALMDPGLEEHQEDSWDGKAPSQERHADAEPGDDDFDLTDANGFRPSAMAISFLVRCLPGSSLGIRVSFSSYKPITVNRPRKDGSTVAVDGWLRQPHEMHGTLRGRDMLKPGPGLIRIGLAAPSGDDPRAGVALQAYVRPVPGSDDSELRLVTLAMVNAAAGQGSANTLFQCGFEATPEAGMTVEPYPQGSPVPGDLEQESMDLLYRHRKTFAIGHGCAASWDEGTEGTASAVRTDVLPSFEVPSLTPDIYVTGTGGSRRKVVVSMQELASGSAAGRQQVGEVLDGYARWIDGQEGDIPRLAPAMQPAARRHVAACRQALERMQAGWALACDDPVAVRAFQLANQAMLIQQVRSRVPRRAVLVDKAGTVSIQGPHPNGEALPGQGMWRPFQIAFVLASLPELVEPTHSSRRLVDLIFFPTGGGKTEAYLGAAAASMFARRLRDPHDCGTDVLMRYTLRLLTSQQFQRAAALACAMEQLRAADPEALGETPFSIGVWVGTATTPNTRADATSKLQKMRREAGATNPFLLLRCPWCAAQFGPVTKGRKVLAVAGYAAAGGTVTFQCPDRQCDFFRKPLPVYVIDEDIYENRPTILIGTVDKFAMLAWKPEGHAIFGLGDLGHREVSPPGLVIQDELHLISGPLGSMVALYEPMIEDLCTDHRSDPPVPPKVIASTATIRGYAEQVATLFGRSEVALFPPHGLEEGHSFFAEPAVTPEGLPEPGRRYLGLLAPSVGSMQGLQVRVAAATLMGALDIPDGPGGGRDGYWTNLVFMNSLRELGNTVSLLESDVPDYLQGIHKRTGLAKVRFPSRRLELTSRRNDDEIARATDDLATTYGDPACLDVCLASNIIEVGIDIDRLALMTIVGQPKTTAQYIQVSGRVGRKPQVSPGLVLTLYGAAKPRDRSHYERFRTYHQTLYSQVEPTSLTPFALPVLERALHAAAILHIRQSSPGRAVLPFPQEEFERAIGLLRARAEAAQWDETDVLEDIAGRRGSEWRSWERSEWSANPKGTPMAGSPEDGLMRTAGSVTASTAGLTWDVPMSMRNVDATCKLAMDTRYNDDDAREGTK